MMGASCGQGVSPGMPVSPSIAPTILLVEDDPLVRELMALEITDGGFGVLEAETADEGLRLLSLSSPALLFTDIRLPGRLNGWQLAEEARRLLPTLPVMYATGFSNEAPRLVPGAVFIRKPYRSAEVLAHIRRLLGQPGDA